MRLTGDGIWGPPADRDEAKAVLRRAVELDVNFTDTEVDQIEGENSPASR
jgi:aryl-alcohol dehydrogenase-like predicted oxidoreductase